MEAVHGEMILASGVSLKSGRAREGFGAAFADLLAHDEGEGPPSERVAIRVPFIGGSSVCDGELQEEDPDCENTSQRSGYVVDCEEDTSSDDVTIEKADELAFQHYGNDTSVVPAHENRTTSIPREAMAHSIRAGSNRAIEVAPLLRASPRTTLAEPLKHMPENGVALSTEDSAMSSVLPRDSKGSLLTEAPDYMVAQSQPNIVDEKPENDPESWTPAVHVANLQPPDQNWQEGPDTSTGSEIDLEPGWVGPDREGIPAGDVSRPKGETASEPIDAPLVRSVHTAGSADLGSDAFRFDPPQQRAPTMVPLQKAQETLDWRSRGGGVSLPYENTTDDGEGPSLADADGAPVIDGLLKKDTSFVVPQNADSVGSIRNIKEPLVTEGHFSQLAMMRDDKLRVLTARTAPAGSSVTADTPAMTKTVEPTLTDFSVLDAGGKGFSAEVVLPLREAIMARAEPLSNHMFVDGQKTPSEKHGAISVQIARALDANGANDFEVRLDPEELGLVRMSFQRDGEQTRVMIWAERPEVMDQIRRHADALLRDLRDAGLPRPEMQFSQDGSPRNFSGGQGRMMHFAMADVEGEDHSKPALTATHSQDHIDIRF